MGSADERLSDVAERIVSNRSNHCVVLADGGKKFVGLLRLADVARYSSAGTRILGDLLGPVGPVTVQSTEPAPAIADLFEAHDLSEAVVLENSTGNFLGLITAESVLVWSRRELKRALGIGRSGSPFFQEHGLGANRSDGKVSVSAVPARGVILLVEDHEPSRRTLSRLLMRRNYDVIECGTVAEALKQATEHNITFVISDIGLPDGTGYDLIESLRREHGLSGIAVSGLSAGTQNDRGTAGFCYHLKKPIDIHQLESALAACTGAREAYRPL